jgi:serine/threonine protein kinase
MEYYRHADHPQPPYSNLASSTLSAVVVACLQEALQKEVGMLTSLNHPNLVRFCGVCLDPPLLVMEYYRQNVIPTGVTLAPCCFCSCRRRCRKKSAC